MLNVGDTVRIIQEVPDREAEWWLFVDSMDKYCGEEAIIEGIEESHGYTGYRLDVDGCNYIWVEAWLTPIESFDPLALLEEEFDTEFGKLLM